MNKFHSFKYKPNSDSENSVFSNLSKKYSNVKFFRKSPGRKLGKTSASGGTDHIDGSQTVSTGSYDMTGKDSEDFKREIGVPILISKTILDDGYYYNNINSNYSSTGNQNDSIYTQVHSEELTDSYKNTSNSPGIKQRSKSTSSLNKCDSKLPIQKRSSSIDIDRICDNTPLNYSNIYNNIYDIPPSIHEESSDDTTKPSPNITVTSLTDITEEQIISNDNSPLYANEPAINAASEQLNERTDRLGEFDMKTSSFQSLNDICRTEETTNRQSDCGSQNDLEYCEHRDQLKPHERRITLLRNKNNKLLKLQYRRGKFTNAWSGLKKWMVQESNRFKIGGNTRTLDSNGTTDGGGGGGGGLSNTRKFGSLNFINKYTNNNDTISPNTTTTTVSNVTANSGHDESNIVKNQDFFDCVPPSETKSLDYTVNNHNLTAASPIPLRSTISSPSSSSSSLAAAPPPPLPSTLPPRISSPVTTLPILSSDQFDYVSINSTMCSSPNAIDSDEVNGSTRTILLNNERKFSNSEIITHNTPSPVDVITAKILDRRPIIGFRNTPSTDWEGQNGFEELRRYVKQGSDFGKDLVSILQERVETDQQYAKSLSKLATKLSKACREIPGSIAEAWRNVATEMENRSEVHRQFSNSITDELVKPLKLLLDSHHKARKAIEATVDKSFRELCEWRTSEAKAKKESHSAARRNEQSQLAIVDFRIQRSLSVSHLNQTNHNSQLNQHKTPIAAEKDIKNAEKDSIKLDNKCRKAEESVKKADVKYYTLCVRTERSRVEWEISVVRGSTNLQHLEQERLIQLKDFVDKYMKLSTDMQPNINTIITNLLPHVNSSDAEKDLQIVRGIRQASEAPCEQLLPDFYCEHKTLGMNQERRKHAIIKLLQLVRTDLERERKSKNGLNEMSQALNTSEKQIINDKLYHARAMGVYLEGALFKLKSALLELDKIQCDPHPLAPHIQITRDRTGLQQSIMKVPWLKNTDYDRFNNDSTNLSSVTANNTNQNYNYTINGDYFDDIDSSSNFDAADDLSTISTASNKHWVDGKNEILLKQFHRNSNRSKSQLEFNVLKRDALINKENSFKGYNNHQIHTILTTTNEPTTVTTPIVSTPVPMTLVTKTSSISTTTTSTITSTIGNKTMTTKKSVAPSTPNVMKTIIKTSPEQHSPSPVYDRGIADGGSNLQDSDFDEFSSQDEDDEQVGNNKKPIVNGQSNGHSIIRPPVKTHCRAIYNYTPKLYDELELIPGDLIEVHLKQEDGWWLGALRNKIGIFPATYVEEIV